MATHARNGATVAVLDTAPRTFDAAALSAYIEAARALWQVPGISVAVVRRDRVLLLQGYGKRDTGKPHPVDAATVFNIGSATKAFTAALIGSLVDEGQLGWSDSIAARLPNVRLPSERAQQVTFADLLSHRSGWGTANQTLMGGISRDDVLPRLQHLGTPSEFRAGFLYNNFGYVAAAAAAEKTTGASWEMLLQKRLFGPLLLTDTVAGDARAAAVDNRATPHAKINGRFAPVKSFPLDLVGPAGGVHSSARDLARWVQLHLNDGREGKRQLLSRDTVRAMQTPHVWVPISARAKETWPSLHFYGYGLGWFLRDYRGVKLVEHGGNTTGMTAHVAIVPELDFGIAILSNADETPLIRALMYRAVDMAIGDPVRDWSRETLELASNSRSTTREPFTRSGVAATWPLDRYAGTYRNALHGSLRIFRTGERLVLRINDRVTGDLVPEGTHSFLANWRDPYLASTGVRGPIVFKPDGLGGLESVSIEGLQQDLTYTKVAEISPTKR